MSEHNVLAILVGAVASFAFGALWYSPLLFLGRWMKEAGVEPSAHKDNPGKIFGGSFVVTIISAFALAFILGPLPEVGTAMLTGALMGLCLVGSSMAINYLFANRSMVFWMIDTGFHVFRLAIVGLVLGLWH